MKKGVRTIDATLFLALALSEYHQTRQDQDEYASLEQSQAPSHPQSHPPGHVDPNQPNRQNVHLYSSRQEHPSSNRQGHVQRTKARLAPLTLIAPYERESLWFHQNLNIPIRVLSKPELTLIQD